MEIKNEAKLPSSHRIFHHGKEEKSANVAKAEDVLVDGDEGLPQICGPPQDQVPPLICLDCQRNNTKSVTSATHRLHLHLIDS